MLYVVIMAGGTGTRFWPESRANLPKQLLPLLGPHTMIQQTVHRLGDLVPLDRIIIATTERLAPLIAAQLPALPREAILIEPSKRDTAPCIGLAAHRILREDPEAIMAVMPSDHVIHPEEELRRAIRQAVALVERDPKRLVTFGIRPTYPAESFGYIERDEPLANEPPSDFGGSIPCYQVKKFHEKPRVDVAQEYVASGRFYWNAGIFVWKARTILEAIREFVPALAEHLERIANAADSPEFLKILRSEFAAISPISIDYAVMERATNTIVLEAPFQWDDVGNWRALERILARDTEGNVVSGSQHLIFSGHGNIVRSADPDHLVVLVGVNDLIVVATKDATLVARKDCEEQLRKVVTVLADRGWHQYL